MRSTIEIVLGAKDKASAAIKALMGRVGDLSKATAEMAHKSITAFRERTAALRGSAAMESEAFNRIHKSALSTYETLDQINARIDAPRKAARAQWEMNRALERYCQLCEEAKKREKERVFRAMHPSAGWNRSVEETPQSSPTGYAELASGKGVRSGGGTPNNAAQGAVFAGTPRVKMKGVVGGAMMLSRAAGTADGALGEAAGALRGVVGAAMMFGPVGAAVAGGFYAIQKAASLYAEAQQKATDKLMEWADAAKTRLAAIRENHFQGMVRGLENVVKAAERASESFERMAKRRDILAKTAQGLDAASAQSELMGMRRDMAGEVAKAKDADKGVVSAEWNLKIAEKELELRERASSLAETSERVSLETARQRLELAEKTHGQYVKAAGTAQDEYLRIKKFYEANEGKDKAAVNPEVVRYKEAYETAEKRAREAAKAAEDLKIDLESKEGDARVNAANRANDVEAARNAVFESRLDIDKAAKQRADAEVKAAQDAAKERDRLDRELHQRRMADLRAEIEEQKKAASPLQAVAAHAQTEFERAFAMYRDPSRAASEIAEERDRSADLKRLHKDANRYGGKWRIDELSQLMAAGDSQGVQSRLEDWRKSKSFTPEVEAMVRASAAEQTKTTAEDELRKLNDRTEQLAQKMEQLSRSRDGKLDGIERNTASLAGKVQELLAMRN